MQRKILFLLMAGVLVAFMTGFAAAGGYGHSMTEPSFQSPADTEQEASNSVPWQERGPVETGSISASQGNSPGVRCCEGDSAPVQGEAGESLLRPGIDDGP